ncbi:MAG: carbohydrate binding family 9 domain-containing protein [Gemmatimonadales bacterium]|nr:carbohydrate binding family 9 domain-containing protein [Gemmatimonadales bacterium]
MSHRYSLHSLTFGFVFLLVSVLGNVAWAIEAADDGSSVAAEITGTSTARGNPYVPAYHPELEIKPAPGKIVIDANLDDPGWRGAAVADNFAEHNPGDQTKPDVDTEVLITYDDKNLYVAWICYDDPDEVRATLCQRDGIFQGDYVILALDTFGENALAYEIAANPYGIQGDLLFSIGRGEDGSYDMIFESEGKITPYGYVVEMAIPFSELRFPQVETQEWRVDFWRNRPRDTRYQYSWAAYDRNESCWPCQWGTVQGAKGIKSGSGLEFLPSAILHQSGFRNDQGNWENDSLNLNPFDEDRNIDIGLGISYDISSEITAEATINPDFSQVESDAAQMDINSTFALFFPERRPFFQEGSDLFDTYFNAVYTRSINDPIAAAKITGRKGKSNVAFLSARDDHSVIILPFEESSEFVLNGESFNNILRFRQEFGNQTYLGTVATDRRFYGGGSGTLAGLDGKLRLTQNDALEAQVLLSHTKEVDNIGLTPDWDGSETFDGGKYTSILDGEIFDGHAAYASYERYTSNFGFDLDYWHRSPTFRADAGFEPGNNSRTTFFNTYYAFRFEDQSSLLERVMPSLNYGLKWNFDGTRKDEWADGSLSVNLRKYQTSFHARGMMSNEQFHGIQFDDIWLAHICGQSIPNKNLSLGGNIDYGHRVARREDVMGKEMNWGFWFTGQFGDRIRISNTFNRVKSDHLDTGEKLFSDYITRSTMSFQASRELSIRLIMQYRDSSKAWEVDPLVSYRINALSTFYVGSSREYRDLELQANGVDGWRLTDRQYFVKLQYLFRI